MKYKIIVNSEPKKRRHTYEFDYGNVKHIKLRLNKCRLSIELETKAKKSADQFFTEKNNYFSEALKKGMLFHLLLYSEPLPTQNIRIFINDEEVNDWNPEKSPVIYSLISKKLEPALSKEWQGANAVFQYFCKNHKTEQKDLAASLYALLYSKTKDSVMERFMYLWMSMNGLYNHLASKYGDKLKKKIQDEKGVVDEDAEKNLKKNLLRNEKNKILLLERVERWGKEDVTQNEGPDLSHKMESILKKANYENTNVEELLKDKLSLKSGKDKPEVRKDINKEAYLNLWYPYYLRCRLFHADQPLLLFSLEKEVEIRCLRFFNARLDNYLDHNLWQYFNEDHYEEEFDRLLTDKKFRINKICIYGSCS